LESALSAFSHHNTDLHSYEVDQGAIHALVLQMGYDASSSDHHELTEAFVLPCLCRVLSGCATSKKISIWQDLGPTELIPLLLKIPSSVSTWSIIRIFCKLKITKSSMTTYPGLLEQVLIILSTSEDSNLIQQVLSSVKDLTYQASDRDKLRLWASLNQVLFFCFSEDSERHKEYIVTIWWNLALSAYVAKQMISEPQMVNSLLSSLSSSASVSLRQGAVATLGNLVTADSNSLILCRSDFWTTLQSMLGKEQDEHVRRRGLRCVRCALSKSVDSCSTYLTQENKEEWSDLLQLVASSDSSVDSRMQALEGLSHLRPRTQALVSIIENSIDTKVTQTACRMLLKRDLSGLAAADLKSTFWKSLLEHFAAEESASVLQILQSLQGHADSLLLDKEAILLQAKILPHHASKVISMIYQMAASQSNRAVLASCDELTTALVNHCLNSHDSCEDKSMAKQVILWLVAEL
jgi:hypothetical protein